ncbi:hypothetical protein BACUNI_04584 [Bacteroides uniformis ATCC 8492]|uniref:Uncharacterized protein n=1 Tax=Bacteroides uniformis (strain ATCC 8492 / DSM 6597 / CCUG 4942 / CIP 103695 / JCM 5828 / KCTC 5204 / NCTC 13054 / VPI 0061) TaxID=411479 RepID=A0ABC9N5S5_BACUC|nr:hypothetical protein BACUNI_04584 [Bacteroides uniformis ATCC 8492]
MNNINHFPCIPLTVPPWRKYCSTVEKISFHHEGNIVPPWWND